MHTLLVRARALQPQLLTRDSRAELGALPRLGESLLASAALRAAAVTDLGGKESEGVLVGSALASERLATMKTAL